jgi:hypothetical protein
MKYIIFVAAFMAGTASAADCYVINNPDLRAACLAQQRKEPATCYAIADPDLRALCRAKVK